MSRALDTLVLESLEESEKSSGEIYHWIKARPSGTHLLVPDALPNALKAMEAAGLIERHTKRKVSTSPIAQWIYRLTADGALAQWAGEVSIPKEYSPA